MKLEIKSRIDAKILFSIETDNFRLAIEAAVKARTDLSYADLSYAELSKALVINA